MAQAQPLKLAEQLADDLNRFAASVTHTDGYDEREFNRLWSVCERLQSTDVVTASLQKSFLCSTTGDFAGTERWVKNAEFNGGADDARRQRVIHLVNHGFGTKALALVDMQLSHRGGEPLMQAASRAAAIGAFGKIVDAVVQSQANGEVVQMTNLYATALNATKIADELGVTDANIAAMVDVAGELLRENKLFWQHTLPDITLLDASQGGPSLGIEYRVGVPPEQATQLGWRLTEQLIERGLDHNGVYVAFLGTAVGS
jgi:hypothetical protein